MNTIKTVLHALCCPIRARWRLRHHAQPFWCEDQVAQLLNIAQFGCWRCGRGATAEYARRAPEPS